MFYQLPPVGNPVYLSTEDCWEQSLEAFFSPYQSRYFASGTAALAAALTVAIRLKNVDHPEVVLPAYGCPDLVSAVVFAGAKPVLVDLEPDRPWMDLEQLPSKLGSRTVAIVAANLFGISERIEQLRSLANQVDAVLIEDSAQGFPGSGESDIWGGDLVVLSFGRGKPVSLLGGGAVLSRDACYADLLPAVTSQQGESLLKRSIFRLKVHLYNWMILPRLYWLPQSLPFLHLGETRYHPLPGIDAMDQTRLELLPDNIVAYRDNGSEAQQSLVGIIGELNSTVAGLIDLAQQCQVPRERRLLRYPLLVDASFRDRLYNQLRRFGLGPSVMYPAALPGILGLQSFLSDQGPFPAAEAFAARILTLPTHRRVGLMDMTNIRRNLSSG